jgi:hypothetical protein
MEHLPALRGEKSPAGVRRGSFLLASPLAVVLALAGSRAAVAFTVPPPAPALAPPAGNVVNVATVSQLQNAVAALSSNTTVLIAPGTYRLTQPLRIRNGVSNVALRGATGNRDDVVLLGSGMRTSGAVDICVTGEDATDILIANLSIGEVFYHPIQVKGELGCDRVRLYNLRLFDAGEQFVKGTVDFAAPNGVDNGIVEYCLIEYTTVGPDDGYTNGVDILDGANWVIRYNLFRNIRGSAAAPLTGPAVLMWGGSSNTICESNTFIDCERAIAFGLGPQAPFAHSHQGGIIRNNFIYRASASTAHPDAGISVWDSPATEVLHNTVIQNGSYPNAIEYRFPGTTGVVIANNLTDGAIAQRDGASGTLAGNLTNATPAFFVDPSIGDLHLAATAGAAIDQGVNIADCPLDWDGQTRPVGSARDVGADEYRPVGATSARFYTVAPCRLVDTRGSTGPVAGPALAATANRSFPLAGLCGIPPDARALSVNVVAVTPTTGPGFFTVYPGGTPRPLFSTINYSAGQIRANNAIVTLGAAGDISVYCGQGSGTAHLVIDVNGYFQ